MVETLQLAKRMSDVDARRLQGKPLERKNVKILPRRDIDVFDKDTGQILLKFRVGVITAKQLEPCKNILLPYVQKATPSSAVKATSVTKIRGMKHDDRKSHILGYFDGWSVSEKMLAKSKGKKLPGPVKLTKFTRERPQEWKRVMPLAHTVSTLYRSISPSHWKAQQKRAKKTAFRIKRSPYSTMTVNLDFRTNIHVDGDSFKQGLSNMIVVENGPYQGMETCFPQYGVGIDVREGDILLMDSSQYHCNLPMKSKGAGPRRLSVVFYLRDGIVRKTMNSTDKDVEKVAKKFEKLKSASAT